MLLELEVEFEFGEEGLSLVIGKGEAANGLLDEGEARIDREDLNSIA